MTIRRPVPAGFCQRKVAPSILAFALLAQSSISPAQDVGRAVGDALGKLFKGAVVNSAAKSWEKIDEQTQVCLANQYQVNPQQMAQQGVHATDSRLAPYISACREAIEMERERIAVEERLQREAETKAIQDDQQRQVEEARAHEERVAMERQVEEEQRLRREVEMKNAENARSERKQNLEARFGESHAEAIMNGVVLEGMVKDAVLEARGEPRKKEIIPPDDEMWIYPTGKVVLHQGRVSYVER